MIRFSPIAETMMGLLIPFCWTCFAAVVRSKPESELPHYEKTHDCESASSVGESVSRWFSFTVCRLAGKKRAKRQGGGAVTNQTTHTRWRWQSRVVSVVQTDRKRWRWVESWRDLAWQCLVSQQRWRPRDKGRCVPWGFGV